MGRPKLDIDGKLVEGMASWGCKVKEIADWFNCDPDTISSRFPGELLKGRTSLKTSLRQWQLKSAKDGNVTMQIWLGKQLLGQADKLETTLDGKIETVSSSERARIDEAKKMLQTMPNERDKK